MSTEGSENDEGSDSQSAGQNDLLQNARNDLTNQHQQQQAQQQQTQQQQQQQPPPPQPQTNMIKQQSVSTPSPASSSPPTQLTMTPSPSSGAAQQQQQSLQQQQQNLQQQQNSNNMTSLPPISTPMSLSHAISTQTASAFMANYSQHSAFGTNFGHPGGTPGNTTQGANYNQAHSGNMAPGSSPYLPSGAGGTYSQLPGHYSWN